MVTLTVGIPVFNGERCLEQAIRSVQAQTWDGDMEILVYNDGSTDSTPAIVERLSREDPRIILTGCSRNLGRPHARNRLLDLARGKYFAWIDDDDEWFPQKLEHQFCELRKAEQALRTENVWCLSPCLIKTGDERHLLFTPNLRIKLLKSILRGRLRAYLHTMLGSTASMRQVGGFDQQFSRLQDLDFFIRFLEQGGNFVCTDVDVPLSVYNKGSRKKDSREMELSSRRIWQKHEKLFRQYGKKFAAHEKANLFNLATLAAFENGEYVRGTRYLLRCLRISPYWTVRYYIKKKLLGL